jgi:long-subunit acyl-CoA synthetase (AMP-forming)
MDQVLRRCLRPALGDEQKQLTAGSDGAGALKTKILTMLGLQDVRLAFTGAAPLPAEIASWYRELGLELLDVYGQSEDFAWSHYSRPGEVRLGYSGTALPGVERRIADNGEILIRSVTRMLGLLQGARFDAQAIMPDGFVRTGDRGEVDELGRLKITGAVKEIFKTSKGKYVSPAPIENRLTHPKFEAVCVTGPGLSAALRPADARARVLHELDDPSARETLLAELQALLDQVNATLEDHERLTHVVVVRGSLVHRQRLSHADHEDQAQRHRGTLSEQGDGLGRTRTQGHRRVARRLTSGSRVWRELLEDIRDTDTTFTRMLANDAEYCFLVDPASLSPIGGE